MLLFLTASGNIVFELLFYLEKNMTVMQNGVHQRGRDYVEAEAVKFSEKNKKGKTTCNSRGLKMKGKKVHEKLCRHSK